MDRDPSEIAKLAERIAKDPKSKLFVPLAEEYKKAGDIDMAVHVLREGLKNNPGYVTARSFLGRLLIEKGELASAQKEFEDVIKAIPDNLLAQKKLGDLYAVQGRTQDALTRYRVVISLNARDQETVGLISDLEAGKDVSAKISLPRPQAQADKEPAQVTKAAPPVASPPQHPVAKPASAETKQAPPSPPASQAGQKPTEGPRKEKTAAEAPAPAAAEGRAETAGGYDFLAEGKMTADGGQLRGLEVSVPGGFFEEASSVVEAPAPEKITAFEGQLEPVEGTLQGLEVSVPGGFFEEAQQPPIEEAGRKAAHEITGSPVPDAGTAGAASSAKPVGPAGEAKIRPLLEGSTAGAAGPPEAARATGEPSTAAAPKPPAPPQKRADDFTTDTLAELYITQGFYEKAIDIYERMLADNPGHQGLIDKLSHLRKSAAEQNLSEPGTPVHHREAEPPSASFDLSEQPSHAQSFPDPGRTESVPPIRGAKEPPNAVTSAFPFGEPEGREYTPPPPAAESEEGRKLSTGEFDLSEGMFGEPHGETQGTPEETHPAARTELTPSVPPVSGAQPSPDAAQIRGPRKTKGPESGTKRTMSSLEQWLSNISKEK